MSLLLACAGGHLAAEPLDKDACGKLQAEKQSLVVLGVDKEFAKGPDWAKANLGQAELDLLKRFLTVEEQLKFRCGMAVVHLQIPDETEDGPDGDAAPSAGANVPMPHRRNQASAAKPAAKPPVAPAGSEPVVVKPVKPVAKPAAPKAQSSWNTETAPVEGTSPAAIDQLKTRPAPEQAVKPAGGRG